MRKIILVISVLSYTFLSAQGMKRIDDEAIVAQEKRQVFQQWGDWKPDAKYFLGIQISLWYSSVWGLGSTVTFPRNSEYRNGEDIRPLKPTGLEVQRNALAVAMKERAEEIKVYSDTLDSRAKADFLHWTSLTSSADPLYLLYYKRMLRPLDQMPNEPSNYIEWGFVDEESYVIAKNTGLLKMLQPQLDLLKEDLYMARNVDMPRGKRFLKYHHILMGWRKFISKIKSIEGMAYRNKKVKKFNNQSQGNMAHIDDKAIILAVMEKYKNNIF